MSTEQIVERPKTGCGNRGHSMAQYQAQVDQQQQYEYVSERPRTSRSNRPKSRLGRESVNYGRKSHAIASQDSTETPQTGYGQPPQPQDFNPYSRTASYPQAGSNPTERPGTSRGYRAEPEPRSWTPELAEFNQSVDYGQYERTERPTTSRSNRQRAPVETEEDVYIPHDGSERPQTSRGSRNHPQADVITSWDQKIAVEEVPPEAYQSGEVNILCLEDDNTKTRSFQNTTNGHSAKSRNNKPQATKHRVYDSKVMKGHTSQTKKGAPQSQAVAMHVQAAQMNKHSAQKQGRPMQGHSTQANKQTFQPQTHAPQSYAATMKSTIEPQTKPALSVQSTRRPSQDEAFLGYSTLSPRGVGTPGVTPSPTAHSKQSASRIQNFGMRRPSVEHDYNRDLIGGSSLGGSSPIGRPESSASLSHYHILPAIGTTSGQVPANSRQSQIDNPPVMVIPTGEPIEKVNMDTVEVNTAASVDKPAEERPPDSIIFEGGSIFQPAPESQPNSDQSGVNQAKQSVSVNGDENSAPETNQKQDVMDKESHTQPLVEEQPVIQDQSGGSILIESLAEGDINIPPCQVETPAQIGDSKTTKPCPANTFKQLTRTVVLASEPKSDEPHIILAVKLPSGNRVQRKFSLSTALVEILHFAEVSSGLDFTGCELICDVPRAVYKDTSMTIEASGLISRTVLHLQLPDD